MIRTNWAADPPRLLWKVPIAPALSSLAIAEGKVVTQERRQVSGQAREFAIALNADTGSELWATELDRAFYPDQGVGPDDGPRSTPTIDQGRVFILTSYLHLFCLDATTGSPVWSKDLVGEFNAEMIPWQNAASPLVVGDLVLVNGNTGTERILAFRKEDGSLAWRRHNQRMTHATPVLANLGGMEQAVFLTRDGMFSVVPASGDVLWQASFRQSPTSSAASPVVAGDIVYCSAAYSIGAAAARVTREGEDFAARELWRTPGANMNHWATPVPHEGFLYGIYGQNLPRLACVEAATGTEKWRALDGMGGSPNVGYGSVIKVANLLLVFLEGGDIVLAEPDPTAYRQVAQFSAVTGKCWNNAAVANGRIYARSTTEAAAYDVAAASVTLPPLRLSIRSLDASGTIELAAAANDGSPLDAGHAADIEFQVAPDLAAGSTGWTALAASSIVTNGTVQLSDPAVGVSQRFYRVRVIP